MKPISGILRSRVFLGAAIVLTMLCLSGVAFAMYLTDATRSTAPGVYLNPADGMCVVGVAADGTMKIDSSIANARDCVAYTTGLTGMTSQAACMNTSHAANDGFKHNWATSNTCVNAANPAVAISLADLDRTLAMCISKGGTTLTTTGTCVAYGWVYMGRKADGSLPFPVSPGVFTTDGTEPADDLGFCYASMDVTSATYADRDTCPSEHNNNPPAAVSVCKDTAQATIAACQIVADHAWSAALGACVATTKNIVALCTGGTLVWTAFVPAGVAPAGEWSACGSNLVQGCQTQASYDAGLGWSLPDSGAVSTSTGLPSPSATLVCTDSAYADQTACEAANATSTAVPAPYYWNPDIGCIDTSRTTSGTSLTCKTATLATLSIVVWADNNRCIYAYGQKGKLAATALPVNTATRVGIGRVVDLTTYTNQGDCLAAGYSWDNWLPNINRTNKTNADAGYTGLPAGAQIVKLDATTLVKDGGGNFASGTGAVCQKCHSDQSRSYAERDKPGYVETRHKKAGDNAGPWNTYFTATTSSWGIKGVQCEICHSTARAAQDDLIQVVPAGIVATSSQPAAGAPISATGHNKTEYGGHVTDVCFHCHGNFPSANAGNVVPANGTDFALTQKGLAPIGNQFLNSPHAKYTGTSNKVDIGNKDLFDSTFIGYLCRSSSGVGGGSIITTMYQSGVAKRIPFLDSLGNPDCSNPGNGSATSGAGGYWVKEGDVISPAPAAGYPTDTSQGNCMTCHDVHWALASTDPVAEPIRRECTTCHVNSGVSGSGAPQIDLTRINHLASAGTPLENLATEPNEACESCHMPKSSATGSHMHLWRISTDDAYTTFGPTRANVEADGAYADAAWVDVDRACGQCHDGSGGPPLTRAYMALTARGMHAVNVSDTPPMAAGACNFNADTWTMEVTDTSIDDHGINQVVVNWGDGSIVSDDRVAPWGPYYHTYISVGDHPITHRVLDVLGQQSVISCTASPAYFTIGGTVRNTADTAPLGGTTVTVTKVSSGLVAGTAITDDTGAYSVGSLKPGAYRVSFVRIGYTFPSPDPVLHPELIPTVGPSASVNVNSTNPALSVVRPPRLKKNPSVIENVPKLK